MHRFARFTGRGDVGVTATKRLRLFALGLALGAAMYLIGGIAVLPPHSTSTPTAKLAPWLCERPQPAGCTP